MGGCKQEAEQNEIEVYIYKKQIKYLANKINKQNKITKKNLEKKIEQVEKLKLNI